MLNVVGLFNMVHNGEGDESFQAEFLVKDKFKSLILGELIKVDQLYPKKYKLHVRPRRVANGISAVDLAVTLFDTPAPWTIEGEWICLC